MCRPPSDGDCAPTGPVALRTALPTVDGPAGVTADEAARIARPALIRAAPRGVESVCAEVLGEGAERGQLIPAQAVEQLEATLGRLDELVR